jgi:predicted helicase
VATRYTERLRCLLKGEGRGKFDEFVGDIRRNINPSVSEEEVIEMLVQHLITKPVFDALFGNDEFARANPVSKSLQDMIDLLESRAPEKDEISLSRFYESVSYRIANIDNAEGRQSIIKELYEKFFKIAFPRAVDKLGIIYTPIEVVDFINESVAIVLREEFGRELDDEGVHIIDPFVGTGTFITRLMQRDLLTREALPLKYRNELHANEIVLLAYYIASVNIENVYHDLMGTENYERFRGICLTDTFQLGENLDIFTPALEENSRQLGVQSQAPIQIIVGNPPYSVGQKAANDGNPNQRYEKLEGRIAETYVKQSTATNKNSLYSSYLKAFRWASDRLGKEGGLVAFITNSGWLDSIAMDGFRKCLEREFSKIYVFDLRGKIIGLRGEKQKREGGNIFNITTGVAIVILAKDPGSPNSRASIKYYSIDDYMSRKEKLARIKELANISGISKWQTIVPNAEGDWLEQRSTMFSSDPSLIPLGDKKDKNNVDTFFMPVYSKGFYTMRDTWCYNFSRVALEQNMKNSIDYYNEWARHFRDNPGAVFDVNGVDKKRFSWASKQQRDVVKGREYVFSRDSVLTSHYRPFTEENCYFNQQLNHCLYHLPKLFPSPEYKNLAICVSGPGCRSEFSVLMADMIPEQSFIESAQCFPLHYYDKSESRRGGGGTVC